MKNSEKLIKEIEEIQNETKLELEKMKELLHENSETEIMLGTEYKLSNNENVSRETKERKKQPSKSYTLKSFNENIQKIHKFGWINKNESNELNTILKNCIQRYTEEQYGNY